MIFDNNRYRNLKIPTIFQTILGNENLYKLNEISIKDDLSKWTRPNRAECTNDNEECISRRRVYIFCIKYQRHYNSFLEKSYKCKFPTNSDSN